MKKQLFLIVAMLMHLCLKAQLSDTVYTHEKITVSLLFPGLISLVDIGNQDYLFEYEENLLLIKAKKNSESLTSLLVRYGEDRYFKGYLGYGESLSDFYYDYRRFEQQPHLPLGISEPDPVQLPNAKEPIDTAQSRQLGQILELEAELFKTRRKHDPSLSVQLESVRNGKRLTYVRVSVANHSSLPYRVEYAGLYLEGSSRKKGLGGEATQIEAIVSKVPEVIGPQSKEVFAFGFAHFAPSRRAKLTLIIRESQGSRAIRLSIPSRYLLYAKSI